MGHKKKSVIKAAGGILWKNDSKKKKFAIVHRHKHDDWSLPKGKVELGESWRKAAQREVLEETGYSTKIKKYAGSISYLLDGKPKIVLFWHMSPQAEKPNKMNGEVDEVRWVTVEEASELLDYPDEIELIQGSVPKRQKGT